MIPTEKNPEINQLIENVFGINRCHSIVNNTCTWCGKDVGEFRNALSRKEFTISGFCQACQDLTFGED